MKLTYWFSQCNDDSHHYSIRTRTKKEAVELRDEALQDVRPEFHRDHFGPVIKVSIEYKDGFALMDKCFESCSGHWEQ